MLPWIMLQSCIWLSTSKHNYRDRLLAGKAQPESEDGVLQHPQHLVELGHYASRSGNNGAENRRFARPAALRRGGFGRGFSKNTSRLGRRAGGGEESLGGILGPATLKCPGAESVFRWRNGGGDDGSTSAEAKDIFTTGCGGA